MEIAAEIQNAIWSGSGADWLPSDAADATPAACEPCDGREAAAYEREQEERQEGEVGPPIAPLRCIGSALPARQASRQAGPSHASSPLGRQQGEDALDWGVPADECVRRIESATMWLLDQV